MPRRAPAPHSDALPRRGVFGVLTLAAALGAGALGAGGPRGGARRAGGAPGTGPSTGNPPPPGNAQPGDEGREARGTNVPTSRAAEARWLDEEGTALVGFGVLRVAPAAPGTPGEVVLRYEEAPTDYAAFDAVQLLVLPVDAFAASGRAFADRALAWGHAERGTYHVTVRVPVTAPAVWLVAFGPFTGVDTSRPLGAARSYALDVRDGGGVARAWVDPAAGELTIKAWTSHPEIERGDPVKDPVTGIDRWFEVRPELVYAAARLAAPGDPEPAQLGAARREADSLRHRAADLRAKGQADAAADLEREAADLTATFAALDDRLPVPAALAERLRRLPFRWR